MNQTHDISSEENFRMFSRLWVVNYTWKQQAVYILKAITAILKQTSMNVAQVNVAGC